MTSNLRVRACACHIRYNDRAKVAKKGRRSYNDDDGGGDDGGSDDPEGPRFPHLTSLDLSGHHCCDTGLVALCRVGVGEGGGAHCTHARLAQNCTNLLRGTRLFYWRGSIP